MQATGFLESRLGFAQMFGQLDQRVAREASTVGESLDSHGMQGVQRCLAADAATRCRVEVTLQPFEIDIDAALQFDANRVISLAGFDDRYFGG